MAVFSHDNRSITYHTEFAPFAQDILLLHSSRFTSDFWRPVLENLRELPASSGRVITCEWFEKSRDEGQMAEDLNFLIKTLGLHSLHVVACDDAVDTIAELEKKHPGRVEKTLFYPQTVPRHEDLGRLIREFSRI